MMSTIGTTRFAQPSGFARLDAGSALGHLLIDNRELAVRIGSWVLPKAETGDNRFKLRFSYLKAASGNASPFYLASKPGLFVDRESL